MLLLLWQLAVVVGSMVRVLSASRYHLAIRILFRSQLIPRYTRSLTVQTPSQRPIFNNKNTSNHHLPFRRANAAQQVSLTLNTAKASSCNDDGWCSISLSSSSSKKCSDTWKGWWMGRERICCSGHHPSGPRGCLLSQPDVLCGCTKASDNNDKTLSLS